MVGRQRSGGAERSMYSTHSLCSMASVPQRPQLLLPPRAYAERESKGACSVDGKVFSFEIVSPTGWGRRHGQRPRRAVLLPRAASCLPPARAALQAPVL